MSTALRSQILTYLQEHNTLTVATEGSDGAWAAALFYVNDGFTIHWLSNVSTRHSQDIANNPRVAIAVHEDYRDWRLIQGIQMEGICEKMGKPAQHPKVMQAYAAKFLFAETLGAVRELPEALTGALAGAYIYRFTPSRVLFIDNTKGLGHREELKPDNAPYP
jgi:uncharacterized protein YhbP (UPF0306 family)